MTSETRAAPAKPISPRRILLASILVPGSGHLLLKQVPRGLMFLFFIAVFGWLSLRLMPETASFVGRHGGAILIWGFCALDAYRIARLREASWRYLQRNG